MRKDLEEAHNKITQLESKADGRYEELLGLFREIKQQLKIKSTDKTVATIKEFEARIGSLLGDGKDYPEVVVREVFSPIDARSPQAFEMAAVSDFCGTVVSANRSSMVTAFETADENWGQKKSSFASPVLTKASKG